MQEGCRKCGVANSEDISKDLRESGFGKKLRKRIENPLKKVLINAVLMHQTINTNMNSKKSLLLAALLATVTTLSSFAQSTPPTGKPEGGRGPGIQVPRIGVPEKVFTTLPQALQDQITKYREQSKTFIDAQRDLAKTLGTVTDEQRNAIREQLKANRDKFLTDTQQVRTEIRDQLKDLGVSVRENKPSGGGGLGGGKGPGRPRG